MRKRIILGAAGATIFIAGILAGILAGMIASGGMTAFARSMTTTGQSHSSGTPEGYCQLYEQTLVSQLGTTQSKLESANAAALQTVIEQMAKDGTITAKQQGQLLKTVQQYGSQPCSHLNQIVQNAKALHQGANQMLTQARQSLATKVAGSLGISTATLNSDLASGQTIPQIASAHNVPLSKVNHAYLAEVETLLSQAVSNGDLTKSQADALYTRIAQAVDNGHYPLLQSERKGTPPAA
jgi:hypothetical protein